MKGRKKKDTSFDSLRGGVEKEIHSEGALRKKRFTNNQEKK